jgi:hypothetical protein
MICNVVNNQCRANIDTVQGMRRLVWGRIPGWMSTHRTNRSIAGGIFSFT